MKEIELLTKKESRESVIGRTEVLDKVGDLLLLPNSEKAITKQVATYYGVGIEAINSLVKDNRDEITSDGSRVISRKESEEFFKSSTRTFKNTKGKMVINLKDGTELNITNRGIRIFPKRAILRVGMLLRDSEIAKEIRTRLLDIVHDTEKQIPEIIHNVVNEISEEKQLMLDRVEAEINGDYDKVSVVNAKLFNLKNKRIEELENENKQITTHALTIIESRSVINRIVRTIAMREYNSMFGKAFGDLYAKVNYILGINIKARDKKKSESYLDTLTEKETFEVEKIVRNWAVKVGIDLDELLKIA
jgi:gas vesicle protein